MENMDGTVKKYKEVEIVYRIQIPVEDSVEDWTYYINRGTEKMGYILPEAEIREVRELLYDEEMCREIKEDK